jgi:S-disulfanyl-L-cysteine oxidoreductase SoxD
MSKSLERLCLRVVALASASTLMAAAAFAQSAPPSPPSSAKSSAQPSGYPGIGREAKPKEVAAWDIDVRPDFKGLPPGSGSVAKGMVVWEAKCASCHGVFGESNEFFNPIVGGTTKKDVQSGRVARLTDPGFPQRTTMMKLSTVSTLWDYIARAMPWTAPKSLSTDEVYAVTAYVLNMAEVLPDDFVLSDRNIADVQQRVPNRLGKHTEHALWPGSGLGSTTAKPDVRSTACMNGCGAQPEVASSIPDFARNAHGNLAAQNRLVGAQLGADTAQPFGKADAVSAQQAALAAVVAVPAPSTLAATALIERHACTACHGMDNAMVGPAFSAIAARYTGKADGETYLAAKIKSGGQGAWGAVPMPPQALAEADARVIAAWLATGAKRASR